VCKFIFGCIITAILRGTCWGFLYSLCEVPTLQLCDRALFVELSFWAVSMFKKKGIASQNLEIVQPLDLRRRKDLPLDDLSQGFMVIGIL